MNNGLIDKVSDGLFTLPTIHKHLVLLNFGINSTKIDSKNFLSLYPFLPLETHALENHVSQ